MTDMMKMTMEMGGGRATVNDVDVLPLYDGIDAFAVALGEGSAMIIVAALAARLAINAFEAGDHAGNREQGDAMRDVTLSIINQTYDSLVSGSMKVPLN